MPICSADLSGSVHCNSFTGNAGAARAPKYVHHTSGFILGPWRGLLSVVLYLAVGMLGMPVFLGHWWHCEACRTNRRIFDRLYACSHCSWSYCQTLQRQVDFATFLRGICGMAIVYAGGVFWLKVVLDVNWIKALSIGILPFILGDCVKIALASVLAPLIQKALRQLDGEFPMSELFRAVSLCHQFPNGGIGLNAISLTINEGDFLLLAGKNGAGKSLLMRHFVGLSKQSAGEVLYRGKPIAAQMLRLRREVGYVFQDTEAQIFWSDSRR